MLTRILLRRFFCFTLLITSFTIYSQQHNTPPQVTGLTGDWSITYNAGIGLNTLGKAGHKISLEISYNETSSNEFVLSIASSKIRKGIYRRNRLLEISVGPRIYPTANKTIFTEATVGAQLNSEEREYFDWYGEGTNFYVTDSRAAFLLSVAFGVKLPIAVNNSLLLRLAYNTTFPGAEGVSYFSGMAGLSFSSQKDPANRDNAGKLSRFAVSAGGGYNNPAYGTGYHYSGSGIYMIEGIFNNGGLYEVYVNGSLNRLSKDIYSKADHIYGLAVGPRFYINKSTLSAFAELGGGVYYADKNEHTKSDPLQTGISFGTGFTGRMTKVLDMYLKGSLCYYLTDNPNFPAFSSVTGGLRFNL